MQRELTFASLSQSLDGESSSNTVSPNERTTNTDEFLDVSPNERRQNFDFLLYGSEVSGKRYLGVNTGEMTIIYIQVCSESGSIDDSN